MQQHLTNFHKMMVIKNFSKSTIKNYGYKLKFYLTYCKEQKQEIDCQSFLDYLYLLKDQKKLSTASIKQNIGAVKFFFAIFWTFPTI